MRNRTPFFFQDLEKINTLFKDLDFCQCGLDECTAAANDNQKRTETKQADATTTPWSGVDCLCGNGKSKRLKCQCVIIIVKL